MHLDQLHQIAIRCTNLDAMIACYRDLLGLRFLARFDPPGIAFFDCGGVRLMLSATASPGTLYFQVADLDAAYRELETAGIELLSPPQRIHHDRDGTFGPAGEEEWMAFFKDPSGNTLALATRRPG